jgi:hypothetical protein
MATDEAPSANFNCPTISQTATAANLISARIIGVLGATPAAGTQTDLEALATQTHAIDGSLNPLVFDGASTNATTAVASAITAIAHAPVDTRVKLVDDPSDAVDVVSAFFDHAEVLASGTPECTSGLSVQDSDGDSHSDEYVFLPQDTPVCWRVVAKSNASVPASSGAQVFEATLEVQGARRSGMDDSRRVLFVVPPQ